jgi:anti-sigma B factor antagonist
VPPPPGADRPLELVERRAGDAVVLAVGGDLDLDSITPLVHALAAAARSTGPVVIDLGGVAFADSSTVNALLQARARLGERMRLASPSPFVRRLFDVIGLHHAMPVHGSVEAALASDGGVAPAAPGGEGAA